MSHVLRFNARDNAIADGMFARAIALDPHFATAFAGRAFALQQEASQGFSKDAAPAIAELQRMAERAVELDPFDPFANMVMGRFHHIAAGRPEDGLFWYDRSVEVSPNFAKGHYARGHTDVVMGRTDRARVGLDTFLQLSPMDPLLALMQTFKSVSFLVDGKHDLARDWIQKATRNNQVHYLVLTTAAVVNHIAGDRVEAIRWATHLQSLRPDATATPFFTSFKFAGARIEAMVRHSFSNLGIPD